MSTGAWSVVERTIRTLALSGVAIVAAQTLADKPLAIVALAALIHGEPLVKWLPGVWAAQERTNGPGVLE